MTTIMGFEGTNRATLALARKTKNDVRKADRISPGVGIWVYADAPPGVGWVLDRRGHSKRYYSTRCAALAAADTLPAPRRQA